MAFLKETNNWEAGIYQLETTDPVLAGPDGIDNLQGKQLANRTVYLKDQIDQLANGKQAAGNAAKLSAARNIAMSGDGSWKVAFDGSGDAAAQMTLSNSGVTPGSYGQVTVDAKGRVTAARAIAADDVPALDWSKIASGKPTTLAGYGIADGASKGDLQSVVSGLVANAPANLNTLQELASAINNDAAYSATVDGKLQGKADKATTLAGYGITDAASKSDLKAIADGINSGKADKATTLAGYGIADGASKAELKAAIDGVVSGAPGALNTLQELAAALGNDANYAASMTKMLSGKAEKATTLAGYGITDGAPSSAVGNFKARVFLSAASGTALRLSPAQSGGIFELFDSTAFTVTLPSPVVDNQVFSFFNASGATAHSIQTIGGAIYNKGIASPSISLPPSSAVMLISDCSNWTVLFISATTLAGYGITDATSKDANNRSWANAFRANKGTPVNDDAALGFAFGLDGDTGLFADTSGSNANTGTNNLSLYIDSSKVFNVYRNGSIWTPAYGALEDKFASKADLKTAIDNVVAGAPGALNTLQELAAALGNDQNFAGTITNSLGSKADKATTLAGYGISDGASKSDLKTAIDGVVSGAPGALNTLQELAAALGNDANYAASMTKLLSGKADKATTLAGYGITDATSADANNRSWASAFRAKKGLPNGDESRTGFAFEADGDTGLFADGSGVSGSSALSMHIDSSKVFQVSRAGQIWSSAYGALEDKFAAKSSTLAGYGITNAFTKDEGAKVNGDVGRVFSVAAGAQGEHAVQLSQLYSSRNKIINGAMRIDQRLAGQMLTPTGTQSYIVDRWRFNYSQPGKLTFQQNLNAIVPPAGFTHYLGVTANTASALLETDYLSLVQVIEGNNVSDLAWGGVGAQPISLQFYVYASLTGKFSGALVNADGSRSYVFTYTISQAKAWTLIKLANIPGDVAGSWSMKGAGAGLNLVFNLGAGVGYQGIENSWNAGNKMASAGVVNLVNTAGAIFCVTGVQLEKGVACTPYEHLLYGHEISLCQRYFEIMGSGAIYQYGVGGFNGSNTVYVGMQWKIRKRVAPSVMASAASSFTIWSFATSNVAPLKLEFAPTVDGTLISLAISGGWVGRQLCWRMGRRVAALVGRGLQQMPNCENSTT
ncbi:hypothetical protein [Chromobacterium sp. IIBBL 290-4]|uniref:hypothetical protein n=1 Tax=Chromobacterium sp. IIBBL 290-4 TaxID=2953890 RepID=UPI0020B8585F|nr:hypothetical protein [Chromobacterium sp. IIBBL 290-4]UTH76114.1 hypothetical protein NKT35_08430 [Chromobacterium sp. IIBBL 290-4]